MPDVRIRIQGDDELRRAMNNPEFVRGPLRDFLQRAAFVIESQMKQKVVVDTGRLRASITTNVGPMAASIGPTVDYAAFVEYGTRPHWAPPGALQPWAGRHGFPQGARGDFLMRWIIARRGTRPHPFLKRTAQASIGQIRGLISRLQQDIEKGWRRRAI